jgi:hypothetical protein
MNTLLLTTAIATSALAALTLNSRDKVTNPQSPVRVSFLTTAPSLRSDLPEGWEAAMASSADDPSRLRLRSLQDIESYALAIAGMKARCEPSRPYLKTRMQALREHVDYARAELMKLPSSQGDPDFTTANAHFHRTMNGLREAFTQSVNELNDGI